jgi:cytochrome c553
MNLLLTSVAALSVAFVTSFSAHAQEVSGNAEAGAKKAEMCIGCHGIVGYKATFPEVYRVPMISGQNAKYIEAALRAYQKGERHNPTMRGIAASLTEQDMADLAAFYAQNGAPFPIAPEQPRVQPDAKVAELLAKGACASCHGANLSKPIDPSYPKIAGQPADYLYVALKSYKDDTHATWGRSNAVMGGIAKQFELGELKALAGYISKLDGELKTQPEPRFRR